MSGIPNSPKIWLTMPNCGLTNTMKMKDIANIGISDGRYSRVRYTATSRTLRFIASASSSATTRPSGTATSM